MQDGQMWSFVNMSAQVEWHLDRDYQWICGCVEPAPDTIGQCARCYRPVYDLSGKRVCR